MYRISQLVLEDDNDDDDDDVKFTILFSFFPFLLLMSRRKSVRRGFFLISLFLPKTPTILFCLFVTWDRKSNGGEAGFRHLRLFLSLILMISIMYLLITCNYFENILICNTYLLDRNKMLV